MNNKEAAKALLEGKTLKIVKTTMNLNSNLTFKFNSDVLCIESTSGSPWNIGQFTDDTIWEEVIELKNINLGSKHNPRTTQWYITKLQEAINNNDLGGFHVLTLNLQSELEDYLIEKEKSK